MGKLVLKYNMKRNVVTIRTNARRGHPMVSARRIHRICAALVQNLVDFVQHL